MTTFGLVGETTPRVFRKPVTLVESVPEPKPVPIAQTPDGQVNVMSATDGGQSATFTWGHEWKIGGVNLFGTPHAGVDWTLGEFSPHGATDPDIVMLGTCSADGSEIPITLVVEE